MVAKRTTDRTARSTLYMIVDELLVIDIILLFRLVRPSVCDAKHCGAQQGSSERSERSVHFELNVRSERVRYFSERETNVQAFTRVINL